jgi:hypothetical protein
MEEYRIQTLSESILAAATHTEITDKECRYILELLKPRDDIFEYDGGGRFEPNIHSTAASNYWPRIRQRLLIIWAKHAKKANGAARSFIDEVIAAKYLNLPSINEAKPVPSV